MFKQARSNPTVDYAQPLWRIIEELQKKLAVHFVDFYKALDSVNQEALVFEDFTIHQDD